MATEVAAHVRILFEATTKATSPHQPSPVTDKIDSERRWTDGTASGQVDRVYRHDGTLGAGATDDFDLLAAGGLTDVFEQAIDADELKAIAIVCNTGEIEFRGDAANQISLFTAVSEGITLSAGQAAGFNLGATGIDVTTNSKFEVFDSDGGGSTYSLFLIAAQ